MADISMPFWSSSADALDLRRLFHGQRFLGLFVAPSNGERILIAIVCALALLVIWLVVWQSAIYVYVHLAYIPITVAALTFGGWGGVVCGSAAGLLFGPLVPHSPIVPDVAGVGIRADDLGWTFRLAAFALFGAGAGMGFSVLRGMTIRALQKGYIDDLTGLPNQQYMARILNTMERSGGYVCVYAVHVTMYRRAMAAFGESVADEIMREVAERMKASLPASVLMFRLYESRIGLIVPQAKRDVVEKRIRDAVDAPVDIEGMHLSPHGAIGRYDCDPQVAGTSGAIRCAVLAAYEAQETGLDLLTYMPASDDRYRNQFLILSDFNKALGTDQLYLVYQPKVDLRNGRVIGCEALVRWRHPERGNIPPGEFVPVIERSGLIHDLTRWVVTEAVRQAANWAAMGIRVPVSINASAHDLSRAGFIDMVLDIVAGADFDHSLLDIEVTESAAFQNTPDVRDNMTRIHDSGIGLSIDDYGTGMSSLYYLREIPATTLKVDQVFVRTLLTSEVDTLLVKSTIELCRALGIGTVAEGIEDEATAHFLRDLGCTTGQGYFYARPLPPDELVDFYNARQGREAGATSRE